MTKEIVLKDNESKEIYLVIDYDNGFTKAVRMSKEQATAINWFINFADLNYGCVKPEDAYVEEI